MKKRIFLFLLLIAATAVFAIYNTAFVGLITVCIFAGDHISLTNYVINNYHAALTPVAMFFAYLYGAVLPSFNKAILYKCCLDIYGEVAGVPIALFFEIAVSSIYYVLFRFFFFKLFRRTATKKGCHTTGKVINFIRSNGFSTTLYMRLQAWFPSELATLISAGCGVKYGDFLKASLWGKGAIILSKALFDNYRLYFIGTPRTIFRLLTISVVITVVFIYKYHKKYRKDIYNEEV